LQAKDKTAERLDVRQRSLTGVDLGLCRELDRLNQKMLLAITSSKSQIPIDLRFLMPINPLRIIQTEYPITWCSQTDLAREMLVLLF
jgi:hypothetical protein